jgi:hypothetical protein
MGRVKRIAGLAFLLGLSCAMAATSCGKRAVAPEGAEDQEAQRFSKWGLEPGTISACEKFKALKGRSRIGEGRIVFDKALPQYVWIETPAGLRLQPESAPEMTRGDLEELLGQPDSSNAERMVYRLGSDGRQEHSIEIVLKDGKMVVAMTSLDAQRKD